MPAPMSPPPKVFLRPRSREARKQLRRPSFVMDMLRHQSDSVSRSCQTIRRALQFHPPSTTAPSIDPLRRRAQMRLHLARADLQMKVHAADLAKTARSFGFVDRALEAIEKRIADRANYVNDLRHELESKGVKLSVDDQFLALQTKKALLAVFETHCSDKSVNESALKLLDQLEHKIRLMLQSLPQPS
ncbi:unnamed protein product [Sympodiomycopsis kandeliae]